LRFVVTAIRWLWLLCGSNFILLNPSFNPMQNIFRKSPFGLWSSTRSTTHPIWDLYRNSYHCTSCSVRVTIRLLQYRFGRNGPLVELYDLDWIRRCGYKSMAASECDPIFCAVVFLFFREGSEPVCIKRLEETNFGGEHRSSNRNDYDYDVMIHFIYTVLIVSTKQRTSTTVGYI